MAKILVVDDESNIRMMLRLALTHAGHTVDTAADGYEGLEKFHNGAEWDLAIVDQRMPGLEGVEVLREMHQRSPGARVLMITAFGTIDLANEAMAAGATDFLRKPFTVEVLHGAVRKALTGEPSIPLPVGSIPHGFDRTAINGFQIRSAPGVMIAKDGGVSDIFMVQDPSGTEQNCQVTLPCYVVELVKAHTDRDEMPGGQQFWESLCGEALANHLWQHAAIPEGNALIVDDLTSGLKHWIDAVLLNAGH